jgi:exodeoxyribonuclease VII large subunit
VQHQKTALCAERLERAAAQTLRSATLRLDALSARLLGVSVEKTLSRGFAIALDDAGRVMRDAAQYKPGTLMTVRLAHGSLKSRVTEVADEESELRPVPSSEQNANH